MAVPKKRTASSKRDARRSHHGASSVQLTPCPKCETPIPSHTACPTCGTYKGTEVLDVTRKIERERERRKQRGEE